MDEVLSESGLDDTTLANELHEIIKAGIARTSLEKATPSDGLRGIEMALRLKDRFPAERKKVENLEVKVQLGKKSTEELIQLLDNQLKEANKWKILLAQDQNKAS